MNQINDTIFAAGGAWDGDGIQGRKMTSAKDLPLNWSVEGRPVFDAQGRRIDNWQAVTRADTGEIFQIAPSSYGILQPAEMLEALDSVANTGGLRYTSGGALSGGRVIFATLILPDEIKIGTSGDSIKPYLAGFNSYDGSIRAQIKALSFRPICRNTAMRALSSENDTRLMVKHTRNVRANMMLAAEALKAANYTFGKLAETYRALARMRFTDRDMVSLAEALTPTKISERTGEIPAQARTARETMLVLFSQGKGQADFADIRGTGWAAYNAVTEYVDHLRPTRLRSASSEGESRLNSAWLGSGAALKDQAFDYLTSRIAA